MQEWILQKVSTEDLCCQDLHKRVSNIQLFPSQPQSRVSLESDAILVPQ